MWLPERGWPHTVVLFTPGKCAARWICFTGLLICSPSRGVAVGRTLQAEQPPQRACLVLPAERAPPVQLRYEATGDTGQVVRNRAGPEPKPGQPELRPGQELVGELSRRTDEHRPVGG